MEEEVCGPDDEPVIKLWDLMFFLFPTLFNAANIEAPKLV